MRTKKSVFQLFLWGTDIINSENVTEGEYDIIELLINNKGLTECNVYECSIRRDYRAANSKKIGRIKNRIGEVFTDAVVNAFYVIPTERGKNWQPREIPVIE